MNAEAWIENLARHDIATPAYVFSSAAMDEGMRAVGGALGGKVIFSVSACPCPDLLMRQAPDVRVGARCASRSEMALVASWRADYAFASLCSMDEPAFRAALGGRFRIIVDRAAQIDLIADLRGRREVAPINLSVSLAAFASAFVVDAASARVGMDVEALFAAADRAKRRGVKVGGLYVYAGPGGFAARGLAIAREMRALAARLQDRLDEPLENVVIGPGLDADWRERGDDYDAYRAEIDAFPQGVTVLHDVGRAAVAAAGCYVTRVVSRKRVAGRDYAICDGGMTQAFLLSQAAGERRLVSRPLVGRRGDTARRFGDGSIASTWVVGPSAQHGDVLAHTAALAEGDTLYFPGAGAYSRTFSPVEHQGLGHAATYVL